MKVIAAALATLLTPTSRAFRLNHDRSMTHSRKESLMLKSLRNALTVAAVTMSLAGLTTTAVADTQWQKSHPRREQVNNRLANQNKRIHQEVKEGDLSKAQAAKLHREDRNIRREERAMASTHHGHITKAEQKALNQQENQVSKQLGK